MNKRFQIILVVIIVITALAGCLLIFSPPA